MFNLLGKIFVTVGIFLGGIFGYHQSTPLTGFTPVEGPTFTISQTVLPADTSITLSSFATPDGRAFSMSNFGAIGYLTLDPTNTSRLETITFTGITQNGNGTATLTGVLRGIDFISPYAPTVSLERTHLVGASAVLSNPAAFYGKEFLFANSVSTSTAYLVFSSTTPPHYDLDLSQSAWSALPLTTIPDIGYVNRVSIAGAANSSETTNGISQLATGAQAAAGTSVGSTNGRLVLPSSLATSTPTVTATNNIPVTVSGKLSQLFWDLTQAFTWTGNHIFNGTVTNNATTTIAASSITNNALVLNTLAYKFPSTRSASSTVLSENGNGVLTWEPQSSGAISTSTTYSMPTSQGSSVTKTVYCVSPKVVASGGVSGLTANSLIGVNWDAITSSYPSATNAWTITDVCTVAANSGGTCSGGTATVYAICVNP